MNTQNKTKTASESQNRVEKTEDETFIFTSPPRIVLFKDSPCTDRTYDNGIRVYRNSPSSATIQIRSYGPINERGNGKQRFVHATASYVGKDQLLFIVERLNRIISEL